MFTFSAHFSSKTQFLQVKDYTLEDILSLTGYIPSKKGKKKRFVSSLQQRKRVSPSDNLDDSDKSDNEIDDDDSNMIYTDRTTDPMIKSHNIPMEDLLERVDEKSIDYDMLGQLVKALVQTKTSAKGSILIFMPGEFMVMGLEQGTMPRFNG